MPNDQSPYLSFTINHQSVTRFSPQTGQNSINFLETEYLKSFLLKAKYFKRFRGNTVIIMLTL